MPTDKRLYPLATCSIGIWSTPAKTKAYLLLLPEKKLFVILLTREVDAQDQQVETALSVNGVLSCLRNQTSLWLRHKNPFVDHAQQPDKDKSVLTFEISWSNVVGMDFKWPLTQDARLVLEASLVEKRVFDDVEAVCLHYQPHSRSSRRQHPSTLQQLAEHHASTGVTFSTGSSTAAAAAAGVSSGTAAAARQAAAAAAIGSAGGVLNKLHVAATASDNWKHLENHIMGNHMVSGSMSRVSSWASWASWASGRSSLEQTPTALEAAAAAAAVGTSSATVNHHQHHHHQQQQQQESLGQLVQLSPCECKEQASASPAACSGVKQQQQGEAECSVGSHTSPGPALCSVPTFEAGISAGSALASAIIIAAPKTNGGNCADKEATPAAFQDLNFVAAGGGSSESIAVGPTPGATGSLTSAAANMAEDAEPVLWPADCKPAAGAGNIHQGHAGHSSIPAAVTPDKTAHVTAAVNDAAYNTASDFSCESSGASFGFWARPLRPLRLLQDHSPAGYATAPCSVPGSPKGAGDDQDNWLLQQQLRQPLVQLYQQQQEGQGDRQSHRPKLSARDFSRGSASRSSRLRTAAAAAADRSCPLCNQPLLQPLNVLQQRFHDKQQHLESRSAQGAVHCSSGGKARSAIGKCRSACSLDQLLEQGMAAGSNTSSQRQQQLQVYEQQQQQQQPGSAKSLAGRAAAAVGELAARCVAAASANSSRDGTTKGAGNMSAGAASTAAVATLGTAAAPPQCFPLHSDKCAQRTAAPAAILANISGDVATAAAAAGEIGVAVVEAAGCASAGVEQNASVTDDMKPRKAAATCCELAAAATPAGGAAAEAAAVDKGAVAAAAGHARAAGQCTAAAGGPCIYRCRTVVVTFKDPTLPYQLKKVVNSNVRMLKLYESGLPAWAVFMPSYGLWYRPWLRHVTWLLFVVLSVVSMAMGFYDLYKNVPYFKQAIIAMFSPAAAVFEWLEHHTQIRLSILLTYMLGKSQIFMQLIKLLTQTSLQPIIAPIAALLKPLGAAFSAAANTCAYLAQPFVVLGRTALLLLQLLWQLVWLLLWSGPMQLLTAVVQGLLLLLQLLLFPIQAVLPTTASIRAGWTAAKATGQAAKAAVPVVKGAAATASQAARSSRAVWGWWWSPLEALELMRISTMRVVKSLQAVVRFFVAMLSTLNQHRLSLMLQLRQQLRGGLLAAAESPAGRVASAVAMKMGQEARVVRLQEQLRRTDSALISVGSDLLPADSAAISAAFTLEGELSLGLVEPVDRQLRTVNLPGSFPKNSHMDGDSDDEVTSGVTLAPISPAQAPQGQWYSSGTGLRYRSGTSAGSSTRPGSYSRLGADSSLNATVKPLLASEDMQWQQQQQAQEWKGCSGSSSNKQVTFATALAEQRTQPAAQYNPTAVSSVSLRRSLDAGVAAVKGRSDVHLPPCSVEEKELLSATEEVRTLRFTLGCRSGSSLGSHGSVGRQVLAARAAVLSNGSCGVQPGRVDHSPDSGSDLAMGQMSRSCDASPGVFAGVLQQQQQQQSPRCMNLMPRAASSGAVRAGHLRRYSWG